MAPLRVHCRYAGADRAHAPQCLGAICDGAPLHTSSAPPHPVGVGRFTYEFTPLVDTNDVLVRRNGVGQRLPTHVAADMVAEQLARTYRQLIDKVA